MNEALSTEPFYAFLVLWGDRHKRGKAKEKGRERGANILKVPQMK